MKSAPTVSSTTWFTDAFVDAAITPMAVISARPIASAPAVAAVRRGLRRPFSRASRPTEERANGAASTSSAPRATTGATANVPSSAARADSPA